MLLLRKTEDGNSAVFSVAGSYSMKKNWEKCEKIASFWCGLCENMRQNRLENVKYMHIYGWDYVKNVIFAVVIKDFRYG